MERSEVSFCFGDGFQELAFRGIALSFPVAIQEEGHHAEAAQHHVTLRAGKLQGVDLIVNFRPREKAKLRGRALIFGSVGGFQEPLAPALLRVEGSYFAG